jgi:hypothetical protein
MSESPFFNGLHDKRRDNNKESEGERERERERERVLIVWSCARWRRAFATPKARAFAQGIIKALLIMAARWRQPLSQPTSLDRANRIISRSLSIRRESALLSLLL